MQGIEGKFTITNPEFSREDPELEYELRTEATMKYVASISSQELEDPRDEDEEPDCAQAILAEIVRLIAEGPGGVFSIRLQQLASVLHRIAVPTDIFSVAESGSEELRRALMVRYPGAFRRA